MFKRDFPGMSPKTQLDIYTKNQPVLMTAANEKQEMVCYHCWLVPVMFILDKKMPWPAPKGKMGMLAASCKASNAKGKL